MQKCFRWFVGVVTCAVIISTVWTASPVVAQNNNGEFYLQVSPSPLVSTLKPGQATTLELKIRNAGSHAENLKIAPRSFKIDPKTQQLQIDDAKAPAVASWIRFSAPTFTIQPGQTTTESVTLNVPKDAGFSYSFVLVINRAEGSDIAPSSGQLLKGSVAIFTLINIDRPGAVRELKVSKFSTTKNMYEYLPATFDVEFTNTGNTIVQPAGNIFVQRGARDKTPIDTLAVNDSSGYILPGTVRTLHVDWSNGFPAAKTVMASDGSTKTQTDWNWSNLSNIRIGRYTAKLVAIYNDGQRDVPIEGEISFWVFPWKLMLGALAVLILVGAGVWSLLSKLFRLGQRIRR